MIFWIILFLIIIILIVLLFKYYSLKTFKNYVKTLFHEDAVDALFNSGDIICFNNNNKIKFNFLFIKYIYDAFYYSFCNYEDIGVIVNYNNNVYILHYTHDLKFDCFTSKHVKNSICLSNLELLHDYPGIIIIYKFHNLPTLSVFKGYMDILYNSSIKNSVELINFFLHSKSIFLSDKNNSINSIIKRLEENLFYKKATLYKNYYYYNIYDKF